MVNCRPMRIHRTRPSSQTRLVEANWKASDEAADAPFWKSDFAIATAAYEHDDDAAEADSAGPEHRRQRHVADRADEAEDGDDRADEDVLYRLNQRRRIGDEEDVEEVVAEQADEAGEQESDRDLLPQHLPVAV